MLFIFFTKKRKDGFIVLSMVLLVSAVVLAVSTGILFRSISEVRETGDSENSLKAWGVVNACGEYALGQLASTTDSVGWGYLGDESLTIGEETCYIYALEDDNGTKIIKASSTVSSLTKKVLIEVATNTPSVFVNSWTEVADF